MKASQTIRDSIDPAWGPAGVAAVERLAASIEAIEQRRHLDAGDYLAQVEDEARSIVSGRCTTLPQVYHLEALLHELDQARRALSAPRPEGLPF